MDSVVIETVKKAEEKRKLYNLAIRHNICPQCGGSLQDVGGENLIELGCYPCGKDVVKKRLFRKDVVVRIPRIWDTY